MAQSIRNKPHPALAGIQRLIRNHRQCLRRTGAVVSQSGGLTLPTGWLSGHSDFGPPLQDKPCNQDRLVLWRSRRKAAAPIDWVIVLADGVTSSYHSEFAAGLACWSALRALVDSARQARGNAGMDAVNAAAATLRTAGVVYRRQGADWHPPDEFSSTWKHRLASGAFLQTTLTLAWCRDARCHLVRIGDGGATLYQSGSSRVLLPVNADTQLVHALGPDTPPLIEIDDELSLTLHGDSVLAVYTDGIARPMQSDPDSMVNMLRRSDVIERNCATASEIIDSLKQSDEESLHDNLTLAIKTTCF